MFQRDWGPPQYTNIVRNILCWEIYLTLDWKWWMEGFDHYVQSTLHQSSFILGGILIKVSTTSKLRTFDTTNSRSRGINSPRCSRPSWNISWTYVELPTRQTHMTRIKTKKKKSLFFLVTVSLGSEQLTETGCSRYGNWVSSASHRLSEPDVVWSVGLVFILHLQINWLINFSRGVRVFPEAQTPIRKR